MDPLINDEAIKDQGALNSHPSYTDKDFEGHRAHDVYVGVHIGSTHRRHPRHRRHRHHHHRHRRGEDSGDDDRPLTPPAQRVHFLLGEEEDDMHDLHPLFSEMQELHIDGEEVEWRETARWVKFEEDVEEGGNRWSKPHVATLSLHSLFELRSCVLNGTVMLDLEGTSLEQIADLVLENMVNAKHIQDDQRDRIKEILLKRHRHLHERRHDNKTSRIPLIRSLADIGRVHSSSKSMTPEGNSTISAPTTTGQPTAAPTSPINTAESHHYGRFLLPGKQQLNPQCMPTDGSQMQQATPATALSLANQSVKAVHFQELSGSPSQGDSMQPSPSGASLTQNNSGGHLQSNNHDNILSTASATDIQQIKGNQHFLKKLPPGTEASNILVGELDFMERTICAFVRLSQAAFLGDLTEVPLPTKFIFILLGPQGNVTRYHEIGRAVATLLADEVFHDVAYKGKSRLDLLAGVDEFLDAVTVLPPGEWDPSIRIEPPQKIPSQDHRKAPDQPKEEVDEEAEEEKLREECGLKRSGRLFGGLINDVKRKAPWYFSDFKDALAIQCLASFIFLYFACLTPIITFGGLLGKATNNYMAAMESLVAGCVCGIFYALFSGQPLTILSSTGPVLVFETIAYSFCDDNGIEYLPFRFWIGVWTTIILFTLVALDASAFVCYITRFTEENFACLISLIFIYNAIDNLLEIRDKYAINSLPPNILNHECDCFPTENVTDNDRLNTNWSLFTRQECSANNGTLVGVGCKYYPDVFFLSIILFASTYIISFSFKEIKTTSFFPAKVRQMLNDFAVIIAILSMTLMDFLIGIPTPKLDVPEKFEPTSKERGWFISPFGKNEWWTAIAAIVPALLATILIFMDQQISAVIVNRKEHKLKKGGGYHLDLFVLAILIFLCSFMGLPWFVAGTVLSVTHVNTLKVESECSAPGEKPKFIGVREQRVTHFAIFIMIGLSVILTPVLRSIPMPVLYGVFLYMGTSSLKDLQFFDRICIMFMPAKYQPDYTFLRQVPLKRVYLFTFIQITCLVSLWVIKTFKTTSIAFPVMLVFMIGIRKLLDFVFTQRELKILDDVMPESTRRKREEEKEFHEEGKFRTPSDVPGIQFADGENLEISLYNGNIMKIPIENLQHYPEPEPNINISEEVNKSGIWKQVNNAKAINGVNHVGDYKQQSDNKNTKKRGSKKDAMNEEERKRLSTMAEEEDEDDSPIMIKIDSPTPTTPNHSQGLNVKFNQNSETSV